MVIMIDLYVRLFTVIDISYWQGIDKQWLTKINGYPSRSCRSCNLFSDRTNQKRALNKNREPQVRDALLGGKSPLDGGK